MFRGSDAQALEKVRAHLKEQGTLYKSFEDVWALKSFITTDILSDIRKLPKARVPVTDRIEEEQRTYSDVADSVQTGLEDLTERMSKAGQALRDFNVKLTKRAEDMARANSMKAHVVQKAKDHIAMLAVQDMNEVSGQLSSLLGEAPELGRRLMLELQVMLDLLGSVGKATFRKHFATVLSDHKLILLTTLGQTTRLRSAVTEFTYPIEKMVDAKEGMIASLFPIERYMIVMIISMERLLVRYK